MRVLAYDVAFKRLAAHSFTTYREGSIFVPGLHTTSANLNLLIKLGL